jgi:hypothetical protein
MIGWKWVGLTFDWFWDYAVAGTFLQKGVEPIFSLMMSWVSSEDTK